MPNFDVYQRLDALQNEAEGLASLVAAIHQAMENGDYAQTAYTPGMRFVGGLIDEHAKKLEALANAIELHGEGGKAA